MIPTRTQWIASAILGTPAFAALINAVVVLAR